MKKRNKYGLQSIQSFRNMYFVLFILITFFNKAIVQNQIQIKIIKKLKKKP